MKYKKITHRKALELLANTEEQLYIKIYDDYVGFKLDYDWEIKLDQYVNCERLDFEENWRGETNSIDFLELYRYDIYLDAEI